MGAGERQRASHARGKHGHRVGCPSRPPRGALVSIETPCRALSEVGRQAGGDHGRTIATPPTTAGTTVSANGAGRCSTPVRNAVPTATRAAMKLP